MSVFHGLVALWCLAVCHPVLSDETQLNLPGCNADRQTDCVAHLFPSDEMREQRSCFPSRYLELWDESTHAGTDAFMRRRGTPASVAQGQNFAYEQVSGEACGISPDFLKPLAKRFSCLDPNPDDKFRHCNVRRPQFGVALEGGGSKTAPFALGVLAGLNQAGLLDKVDLVASVSGGSYAAHYYFSRLLDAVGPLEASDPLPKPPRELAASWFADCIPHRYRKRFADGLGEHLICPYGRHARERPSETVGKLLPGDDQPVPDQGTVACQGVTIDQCHARFYNDLIYPLGDWRSADDHTGLAEAWGNVVFLLMQHFVTLVPHHLAHSLFDWPENFSPSREAYRAGIERAFGHTEDSWRRAVAAGPNDPGEAMRVRSEHTLGALGQAYRNQQVRCGGRGGCGFPLWVMGSANSMGRSVSSWLNTPERDALRIQFETTPVSQGSGAFGWADRAWTDWRLRDAAGASAAFADDQQRLFAEQPMRFLASSFLHLFNANWGTDLPNYAAAAADRRWWHRFAFWPLYGLPAYSGMDSPYIHLSDGGNTDNLGLLALLRRGTRNIVVSASSEDRMGQFPSLCETKNQLELDGEYRLLMPELASFDRVCNQHLGTTEKNTWGLARVKQLYCQRLGLASDKACDRAFDDHEQGVEAFPEDPREAPVRALGYSLWNWPAPVIEGCVVRGPQGEGDDACPRADYTPDSGRMLISRLFVIKPAIRLDNLQRQLAPAAEGQPVDELAFCGCQSRAWKAWEAERESKAGSVERERIVSYCPHATGLPLGAHKVYSKAGGAPLPAADPMDLPCQSLAFLTYNACADDRYPHFPQNSFVFMTFNSSHTLFAAYYDLGRHYASQLRAVDDHDGANLALTRPRTLGPAEIPLQGYRYSDRRAGTGSAGEERAPCQ